MTVLAPTRPGYGAILTKDALDFVAQLEREFGPSIESLLAAREAWRARLAAGEQLAFLPHTAAIRNSEWRVPPAPADLSRRFVEITGPVDRKMMINALNSGADVFMADFEDATSPTWDAVMQGQVNVRDAVRREIAYDDPVSRKAYRLAPQIATLIVRPRGLHLVERHLLADGRPTHACLVDFGLCVFHNARQQVVNGSGPYFYLPKLESHLEARLWNDVFIAAQKTLGLPPGTIRATVLIETLPAAFEMDEILWELRDHITGLNCGRWDYIFSSIKVRRHDPLAIYPDRAQVTMTQPNMRAYTQLAIRTCHRRGAHAMGGMSAFIPSRDADANEKAFAQVRADKDREATDGHDGTWVAHPGMVAVAREAFAARVTGPNQLDRLRNDIVPDAAALLELPTGSRTEAGLRQNIGVGIRYLEAWLRGQGAVPLHNLMEDAATAEISRTQAWQWVRHAAPLDDGRVVTAALVRDLIADEMEAIARELGEGHVTNRRFDDACRIFTTLVLAPELAEFLTTAAYDALDA
ncbi:MAG TPA: malate synthase A [Gemmatimonadaceae bacterium]|nr:malate synthase A [Gemmatimonadaceae bacterium]